MADCQQTDLPNLKNPSETGLTGSLCFFMRGVLPAKTTKLAKFQPRRGFFLVLRRGVITALTITAGQLNDISHVLSLLSLTCLSPNAADS
jgi:hypothetical protein